MAAGSGEDICHALPVTRSSTGGDSGAASSLREFQCADDRFSCYVMLVTFLWLTPVSNLSLTCSRPRFYFFSPQAVISPFKNAWLHNLRQEAASDQTAVMM